METLGARDVRARLTMTGAIDALQHAIGGVGFPTVPQRLHLAEAGQQLLVMPSMADGYAGVKLITIDPDNPSRGLPLVNGTYTLFGPPGLQPAATIDGRSLTELRTAAVSGLATRALARPDAGRLVVIGAGAQARTHLLAMAAVRQLTDVAVVARRADAAAAFVDFARSHVEAAVRVGTVDDVDDADLVCTCTSADRPILDGTRLPPGVHVNAIGAYQPTMAEIDPAGIAASKVVVETRAAALAEKGDLLQAEEAGVWSRHDIAADLTELLQGTVQVRTSPGDRTLFASVGNAYEDLVVARAIVDAGTQLSGTSPR